MKREKMYTDLELSAHEIEQGKGIDAEDALKKMRKRYGILGHTEAVNESNYTYDISDLEYKRNTLEKAQKSVI